MRLLVLSLWLLLAAAVPPGDTRVIAPPANYYPEPAVEHTGNASFTSAEIRAGLSDALSLVDPTSGEILAELVERRGRLISRFYREHGFVEVTVSTRSIDQRAQRVVFEIHEGPRFKVGAIRIIGKLLRSERTHLVMLETGVRRQGRHRR